MTRRIRVIIAAMALAACGALGTGRADADAAAEVSERPVLVALSQPAQPAQPAQAAPEGFEPVSNLPPVEREQLPAAPLVLAAYAFVWALLLGYVWSIWRRLGAVEREMKGLASRVDAAGRQR